jgi:excinuclease ABC subunit C
VTPEAYRTALRHAGAFLQRRPDGVLSELRREMAAHAARLEFERAKWTRDVVAALEGALVKQVVERQVEHDQDVLWFGAERVLKMRVERGALVGLEAHPLAGRAPAEFLLSHYGRAKVDEVIVPPGVAARVPGVRIRQASRGAERQLLKLCELNYRYREEESAW